VQLTDYHAKFFACELTRRNPSEGAERLASALVDAQVDLNPHQVEAALFAFRSPLAKGALLADEVGLGKTIEAGLVISQRWAERKRKILVITPANLRKQWHQELSEKFFLPCRILESKSYNHEIRRGNFNPFTSDESVAICSYQFARSKASDVNAAGWDLVVIDEAHRLRNVYKTSNVVSQTLRAALQGAPKLLLTATPLQNSLLELFGLMTFVDEYAFGDLASFRAQFMNLNAPDVFATLKARLSPHCHRTLRRQVTAYVSYTRRHPLVQPFSPEEGEDRLYHLVSDYLRRDNLQALPNSQRSLMTLVLRKLLASSTFAIAGALETLIARLRRRLERADKLPALPEDGELTEIKEDIDGLDETEDEWDDDDASAPLTDADRAALAREIEDLESFRDLAVSIGTNAKGRALLIALEKAFAEAKRLGAAEKAIIFTESRKTQDYLLRVLAESPYADRIVLFNGSNSDERSKAIYADWLARHDGTDKVTGSRTADMRSALVDYFREEGQIMIATEAGAEGINLQFCSLVVNYDLPWNPQRIEQRIGRCHRYGQKHDVVVVNFLNQKNEADQRVFRLLSEKFTLFEGVFGASDEVLGAIESGVDFEKRIARIYQQCRTPQEIQLSFDDLQADLSSEITAALSETHRQLLENFDEEVREKLRVNMQASQEQLGRYERLLMNLTRHELASFAEFIDGESAFRLKRVPPGAEREIPLGRYELPRRSGIAHYYRLGHPLAGWVLRTAQERPLGEGTIDFDYDGRDGRISVLEPLRGKSGWMAVSRLTVESLDRTEDHLLTVARLDDGSSVPSDVAVRLFSLPGRLTDSRPTTTASRIAELAAEELSVQSQTLLASIATRNGRFFDDEMRKLEEWADDLKAALEREIKDLDRQIRDARRAATHASSLEAKVAAQKHVRSLEGQRTAKRRGLFDAQDQIDTRRDDIIQDIEARLAPKTTQADLLRIRWRVI
jgi:adenine-specific DNA-methyltransferase